MEAGQLPVQNRENSLYTQALHGNLKPRFSQVYTGPENNPPIPAWGFPAACSVVDWTDSLLCSRSSQLLLESSLLETFLRLISAAPLGADGAGQMGGFIFPGGRHMVYFAQLVPVLAGKTPGLGTHPGDEQVLMGVD